MSEKKAIRMEIEYDNGELWRAEGEDAKAIVSYWNACAAMTFIHGARYTGPVMKLVRETPAEELRKLGIDATDTPGGVKVNIP